MTGPNRIKVGVVQMQSILSLSQTLKGFRLPDIQTHGVICAGCEELERACVAHLHLTNKMTIKAESRIRIDLHANFQALMQSARDGCHLCRCWAYALISECLSSSARDELYNSKAPVSVLSPIAYATQLKSGISDSRIAHYFRLQSMVEVEMRLGSVSDGEFRALMHRKDQEVVETATKWLSECHISHPACADHGNDSILPTRLVDVRGDHPRVVDGSSLGRAKYVALSYCWGGDQVLKLTSETQNALRTGIDSPSLARTIQDAIRVCKKLEIGFLWVDALCILQDEGSGDWDREAANIHQIYGNAYVTLSICSAASASDGFMDVQWPETLSIDPKRAKLVNMLPNPCRKTLARIRTESPLADRGWIFQEELLSPRILYWSDQGLFWSCSTAKYAENGTADFGSDELFPHILEPVVLDPHEFYKTDDPLLLWDDMITSFSVRDFAIDEDRLPAVSGLATLIQRATGEDYLMGLWKGRLPGQLLWIITTGPRPAKPGRTHLSLASVGANRPLSPSWSWASISPARKIVMPRQASSRAQFLGSSWQGPVMRLHLAGRSRPLTSGLSQLAWYPDEERAAHTHLQFPALRDLENVWAMSEQKRHILICLNWKRPIVIHIDNEMPRAFDNLICFEINYIGLLLLEPVPMAASQDRMYRRIGCAQAHRESNFFAAADEDHIALV